MYESHFGLRQRPFPALPDSAGYYPATGHERALARLQQGLACDEGMVLLTGEPGLGKTLLAHVLLDRLGTGSGPTLLTGGPIGDPAALFQAMLFDLDQPYEGRTEQELRLAVTDQLLRTFQNGGRTILVVDEAHALLPAVLDQLRLLGNLEAHSGKALQVVLLALPSIAATLARPELASLRQRLAIRATLGPLPAEEAADYLLHHLRATGARPEELLPDEALQLLVRGSRGIPRLLNQSAHQALLLAWEAQAAVVDVEAVHEALSLLGLDVGLDDVPEGPSDAGDDTLLPLPARPA
jgi:type II secretory pathway predicted ATPase ExeA